MLAIYQTGIHSLLLPVSSTAPQGQKGIESGQKVAKVNIYFLAFVFSRENRRPKGAKSKHIFEIWYWRAVSCAPLVVCFIVPTGGICAGFRTCRRLALVLLWCVPCLLSAFLLCLPGCLRIWLYFAF